MANLLVRNETDDAVTLPAPFGVTLGSRETRRFVGINEAAVLTAVDFRSLVTAGTIYIRTDSEGLLAKMLPAATPDPFQPKAPVKPVSRCRCDVTAMGKLTAKVKELDAWIKMHENRHAADRNALSGNIALVAAGGNAFDVSAAELNAAAASGFTRALAVQLMAGSVQEGMIHQWAGFDLVVSSAKSNGGAAYAAPTVTGGTLRDGRTSLLVTFDTDAGATKTYVAAETLTVDLQTRADDLWLGHAVTPLTVTFTVIA